MQEIRQDPTTREWVIIATERAKRPREFTSLSSAAEQASRSCVFCRGNEIQTPPEVWRLEVNGWWRIRVVGNKFPALSSKATVTRYETPPFYRSMNGFGYQRVVYRSDRFLVFEPYASRFPFETWIAPFTHNASFGNTTNQELQEL